MTKGKKKYIIQAAEAIEKGIDAIVMMQQIGQEEKASNLLIQM